MKNSFCNKIAFCIAIIISCSLATLSEAAGVTGSFNKAGNVAKLPVFQKPALGPRVTPKLSGSFNKAGKVAKPPVFQKPAAGLKKVAPKLSGSFNKAGNVVKPPVFQKPAAGVKKVAPKLGGSFNKAGNVVKPPVFQKPAAGLRTVPPKLSGSFNKAGKVARPPVFQKPAAGVKTVAPKLNGSFNKAGNVTRPPVSQNTTGNKHRGLETRGVKPLPGTRTIQGQVDAATKRGNPTIKRGGQDLVRLRSSGHGRKGASATPQNVRRITPNGRVFTGRGADRNVTKKDIKELYKAQTKHGTSSIRTRSGR